MLKLWRYPPQKIQSSHLKQQKLNSKNKHGRLWCMKPKTAFFTPVFEFFRVCLRFPWFFFFFFFGKNYSYFYFPCQQQRKRALQKQRLARTAVFAQPLSICFFYYLGAWNKLYHWFTPTNMITSIVQRAGLSLTAIKVLIWIQGLV